MTQFTQTPDLAWLYEPVAQVDTNARAAAEARQAQLTKPPGSLGRLEQLAVDFAGWQGRSVPAIDRIGLAVFAADHGADVLEDVEGRKGLETNYNMSGADIQDRAGPLGRRHSSIKPKRETEVRQLRAERLLQWLT